METNDQTRWPRVTKAKPCPICGKGDACKVSPDGAVCMCKRLEQGAFKKSKGWYFHRLIERPRPDAGGNGRARNGNGSPVSTPTAQSKAPKAFRTFDDAVKAAAKTAGGVVAGQWVYYRSDGTEFGRVLRFNLPDGDKQFRPIYEGRNGWKIGDPSGLWPLYRVNELPADGVVWIVEGEKATDAARAIGLAAVTSAHGSSSAEKSDWASSLRGRTVCILRDNDEPGGKYGDGVARILIALGCKVKVFLLPGLPEGGDVVEFIGSRDSQENEAIAAEIVALAAGVPFIDAADIIGGLVTRCLNDVETEVVSWLWPNRFALGKLSLIGGIPGAGKSWLSLFIAAAISRAMPWPDGRGNAPLGSVLIANAEDGTADTVKPRLEKMGADCRKVYVLDCVKRPGADGKLIERGFTLADVGPLEDAIRRLGDCRAVVIDPVSAFLSDADEHKNAEVRSLLKPLAKLAERYGVAVVLITHLTKGGGANSVHRMIGSIAFAGAARSVWMIAKDPKNPARRLMLLAKCNIAADEGGLAYSIVDGSIAFEAEAVTQSADEVLAEQQGAEAEGAGRPPDERTAAVAWLQSELADGAARKVSDIRDAAKGAGIPSGRTLDRAAAEIGVERKLPGFGASWTWRLPQSRQQSRQNPREQNIGETGETGETPSKTGGLIPSNGSLANNLFSDETDMDTGGDNGRDRGIF